MTSMRKLVNQRSGHRADVRKRIGVANALISNFAPDKALELRTCKSKLAAKEDVIARLDEAILDLLSEDASEEQIASEIVLASDLSEEIELTIRRIDACVGELPNGSESAEDKSDVSSVNLQGGVRARLPKIELVKFNGDPKYFQTFWDSFESIIHKNNTLSNIDRFNYLRAQLVGPAASCIAGIPSTIENYQVAVDILKDRFGKKVVVVSSHMDALMKLPIISDGGDTRSLRRVYDKVEAHVRSLEALGIKSEDYGALLVPVILSRLPEEMKLIVSRSFDSSSSVWELKPLLDALRHEIEARERASLVTAGTGSGNYVQDKPTAAALMSQDVANYNNCCFCRGRHVSSSCKVVSNVEARKDSLRKSGRCFQCLRLGHVARSCRSFSCAKCGHKHNIALCTSSGEAWKVPKRPDKTDLNKSEKPQNEMTKATSSALFVDVATSVLLQTARGLASSPRAFKKEINIRLILDPGSQRTYVTQRLFKLLKLPCVGKESLRINTFGNKTSVVESCSIAQLRIRGRFGKKDVVVMACVVPEICPPPGNQQLQFAKDNFEHLFDLELADDSVLLDSAENNSIDVLVGSDFYWAFVMDKRRRGKIGPVAIETRLGWVLSGPVCSSSSESFSGRADSVGYHTMNCFALTEKKDEVAEALNKFWSLESLGIDAKEEDDQLQKFADDIVFDGKRYEVGLPFRDDHEEMADNYNHCRTRLTSLLRKLRGDPKLREQYDQVMQEQLEGGVLEPVSGSPPGRGQVYYMPHFCVVREDKDTTKVRVVYDASARVAGPSLNHCIHEGPSLITAIFNVLLRFRFFSIGLSADIEKAFHQISIKEQDRNFLRVLWVDDVMAKDPRVVALRFTRCVFGVSSSPFHLNATLRHHLGKYLQDHPTVVENLKQSLYVDDVTAGVDTVDEGISFFLTSRKIMDEGGFNLRKWATNCTQLASVINSDMANCSPESDYLTFASTTTQNIERPDGDQEQKVLGVLWDREHDELKFRFDGLLAAAKGIKFTKRGVLSLVAKNYDPLGLLSPLLTPLKVAFQNICKGGGSWDAPVDAEVESFVRKWLLQLEEAGGFCIPRYCLSFPKQELSSCQLIGFCDASCAAYGASVYVRTESSKGVNVSLLASKTKVAPLKEMSVPRLELMGMLVLAMLVSSIMKVVSSWVDPSVHLFSDSMTALYWVTRKNKRYKQWVERRADTIRSLVGNSVWGHVQGNENPADLQSRGVTPQELRCSTLWFQGPEWLRRPRSAWPGRVEFLETEESVVELRAEERRQGTVVCVAVATAYLPITDYSRFSSYRKLLRVVAYVLKFICRCRKRGSTNSESVLTADELAHAELRVLRNVQELLRSGSNFKDLRKQLVIYEDHLGILRSKSRFENSSLLPDQKFPIVLPKDHHVSELVTRECHFRIAHRGVEDTMVEVRAKFWIPSLRQLAKRVIRGCYACKRVEGLPYNLRPFPPLPIFRVQLDEPFKTVGTDFAGPLYLRETNEEDNKGYVLLFTCAASRAVHLELVSNLSAQAFVNGLRRFIARRGAPHLIISDNAKTFQASETKEFLLERMIKWQFNVPDAPWTGGFFEAMIKLTKRCLRKVLLKASLSSEEMSTILTEIEGVLNNRPLTHVTNDDTLQALTPNHLIFGRRLPITAEPLSEPGNLIPSSHTEMNKRLAHKQKTLKDFCKRWSSEYLLSLRQHQKAQNSGDQRVVKVGDVVLLYDNERRIQWRLARVVELIPSSDGEVRSVKVLLGSAKLGQPRVILTRSVGRLYPIEVMAAETLARREGAGYASCPAEVTPGNPIDGLMGEVLGGDSLEDDETSDSESSSSYNGVHLLSRSSSQSDGDFDLAFEKAFGQARRSERQAARQADFQRMMLKQA